MDCNKDEAIKAKEIAEKKLEEKDYNGAKKFGLKAQSLYSELDGLQQLLMTVNVYTCSENKVDGVVDYYGVLGIDPSSDYETVRKQYRKLALILHPDKNKSAGAEGAFKLLFEAWSLLSDKVKRAEFDRKRMRNGIQRTSMSGVFEKVIPTHPSKPTMGKNGLYPKVNNLNATKNSQNLHLGHSKRNDTFWTVCTSCKMQFEYVLHYLNKKLQCYSCKEAFLAIPTAPPKNNSRAFSGSVPQNSSAANLSEAQIFGNGKTLNGNSHTNAGFEYVMKSKINEKRVNVGEASGEKPRKRRRSHELKMNENIKVKSEQLSLGTQSFGVGTHKSTLETEKVNNFGMKVPVPTGEMSLLETRTLLIEKARKDISKMLNEWKNGTPKQQNGSNKASTLKDKQKSKMSGSNSQSKTNVNGTQSHKHLDETTTRSLISETEASDLAMAVPDSDFHDFDKDRIENSFGDNQVWTAYDNDDGMPRYYALIHNVLSRKPFKMRISWLNSKNTSEFGDLNWVGCGFYKTSGDFRVGKHELNKNVNSFSQRVKWAKGPRGAIRILPSKGDVWALYKNWSSDWNEHTLDEIIHKYEMVEVLTDYDEEKGVSVIPLVKVNGFKTVFCQHTNQKQVRMIPREEMFRFSHQVPSFLLTGIESESFNAPKGCLELDPAAIPTELVQVNVETSENMTKTNAEDISRDK